VVQEDRELLVGLLILADLPLLVRQVCQILGWSLFVLHSLVG